LRLHATDRRVGGLEALTRLQPDHDVQPPVRAGIERRLLAADERVRADRNRHVERPAHVHAEEVRRRDADDRERHAFDRQRTADRVGRAAEPPLPEVVTDDRDGAIGAAAASIVSLRECPAQDRGHAEHVEETPACPHAVDELGRPDLRQVEAGGPPDERAVEEPLVLPDLFPDRVGPGRPGLAAQSEDDEPLRFLHGQRPQHEAVEDGKDRRVRPDAERKGEDRHERDDRGGFQRTERITEVLHAGST
jgi:hypothetical protein